MLTYILKQFESEKKHESSDRIMTILARRYREGDWYEDPWDDLETYLLSSGSLKDNVIDMLESIYQKSLKVRDPKIRNIIDQRLNDIFSTYNLLYGKVYRNDSGDIARIFTIFFRY